MKKLSLALAISAAVSLPTISAPAFADDSVQFHGYSMVASNFRKEAGKPKNLALHMDPTGPNQDPRGKMGDLGNTYWHDYWTAVSLNKRWEDIYEEGQWADFTFELVGYGNKDVEASQNYARLGGLSFLPEDSNIWAGRRYFSDRVQVFAYNIKEVNIDAGIGYNSKNFDISIGTSQIDYAGFSGDVNNQPVQAIEGSREILDLAYRVGKAEFGATYLKELESFHNDTQQALSVFGKYKYDSFMGLDGDLTLEAQVGKGVIAQYLNTSRISALSEDGDISARLSAYGIIMGIEGFNIRPALILEKSYRENTDKRTTHVNDGGFGGIGDYGNADETGIFAGITVGQTLTENLSMQYEAIVNRTWNKDGNDGVDGTSYKLAMGPAVQLKSLPWVAPKIDVTVAYVGGDEELTFLNEKSEWRFGYRMEVWF
ncbi:carbohydrate porin [Vibrio mangrovi]|uniref:Carbohydrate porin n=1 Tax=Vibrio mangrovi TaxID=474394 RepID=A0A1Y6ISP3_9VIBR|nr:carbohydrate porin [Vibrio mangrovi]MDW6003161.1 carbohydrate porin [Vibrio mangrovi]SMS00051.1 LamB porin [Vibrio mangrovi]